MHNSLVDVPPKVEAEKPKPAFVPSKWETVDESELEKQGKHSIFISY